MRLRQLIIFLVLAKAIFLPYFAEAQYFAVLKDPIHQETKLPWWAGGLILAKGIAIDAAKIGGSIAVGSPELATAALINAVLSTPPNYLLWSQTALEVIARRERKTSYGNLGLQSTIHSLYTLSAKEGSGNFLLPSARFNTMVFVESSEPIVHEDWHSIQDSDQVLFRFKPIFESSDHDLPVIEMQLKELVTGNPVNEESRRAFLNAFQNWFQELNRF